MGQSEGKLSQSEKESQVYDSEWVNELIQLALKEDAGELGDITSYATIPKDKIATAKFLAKDTGVLSGLKLADKIFAIVDENIKVEWSSKDGDRIEKGTVFGLVNGPAQSILTAERIALNFMQRMSGVATATNRMVSAVSDTKMRILDTRKTVPGHRLLDKLAVVHGGGMNHRIGLYDLMMIKDNHITAAGGIRQALEQGDLYLKSKNIHESVKIEIETSNLDEVQQVLSYLDEKKGDTRVSRIMLDNMVKCMDITLLTDAVKLINKRVETEASGNVTLETVRAIAESGVDFVSSGSMTHSVKALDISLKIQLL